MSNHTVGPSTFAAIITRPEVDERHALRLALEKARDGMLRARTDREIQQWCAWIMQEFLVAGRRLTADDEAEEAFVARYPHQARAWAEVRALALSPSAHLGQLLFFLKTFGRWLVRETERDLGGPVRSRWRRYSPR